VATLEVLLVGRTLLDTPRVVKMAVRQHGTQGSRLGPPQQTIPKMRGLARRNLAATAESS